MPNFARLLSTFVYWGAVWTLGLAAVVAHANENACVRDLYMRAQKTEACDALFAPVGNTTACAQRQCPQGMQAQGMLCVFPAGLREHAALSTEQLRVALDLAYTHVVMSGPVAEAVVAARRANAPVSPSGLTAERFTVQALDSAYAILFPSLVSADPSEGNPSRAAWMRAIGAASRTELFTPRILSMTQSPELAPVRLSACGDTQRRPFTSNKTLPAQPSTAYALAMGSGAKAGQVLRLKADLSQCVSIKSGAFAQLHASSCNPLSAAHHLSLQEDGRPLQSHSAGPPQCVRVNHVGVLYVSRCESQAPLPAWQVLRAEKGSDPAGLQIKQQGTESCISLANDQSLRLAPCANTRGPALERQVWSVETFRL